MSEIDEIKKLLNTDNLILGAERTLKELRKGTIRKVYLAENPKPSIRNDIKTYAKIAGVEVIELEIPNDELGTICKKPFPVSVISIKQ